MPLPIQPVTQAEWDEAPTVHDLMARGLRLVLRDPKGERMAYDIRSHMRRLVASISQTKRAREVVDTVFGFHGEVMQASTTRIVVDFDDGGPMIHLRAWNDAYVIISSYADGASKTYAVGYLYEERLLWSDEIRLSEVRSRFDRTTSEGRRFAERLELISG